METLSTETSFSYHMLLTAFFAPKHHRSAFYFLRKVEDGFCSSVVRGCRGGSGRETKGTPYLMVLSNYAPVRLLLAQVLIVQPLRCVWPLATPWAGACQASLCFTISWSLLTLMSIESVMPSHHLILCRPLLLLPSIFPGIRGFSNESALRIRWPKYWSVSFSITPSSEYSGLVSFRLDWFDGSFHLVELSPSHTWGSGISTSPRRCWASLVGSRRVVRFGPYSTWDENAVHLLVFCLRRLWGKSSGSFGLAAEWSFLLWDLPLNLPASPSPLTVSLLLCPAPSVFSRMWWLTLGRPLSARHGC